MEPADIAVLILPLVGFLGFVCLRILSRRDQPVHHSPFCNGRTMDAGTGGDVDIAFAQDGVL